MRLIPKFLALALASIGNVSLAEEASDTAPAGLKIELNDAADIDGACRLSFLVENRLGAALSEAVFETVLFDATGAVDRLTLFDMRDLPTGRPRVRQFQIDDVSCARIGRILINDAQTCKGEDMEEGACMDDLDLTSRTDIELLG